MREPTDSLRPLLPRRSADNNVQLTVVKTPYDEAGSKNKLILRVYESEGKDGSTVTLTLPQRCDSREGSQSAGA